MFNAKEARRITGDTNNVRVIQAAHLFLLKQVETEIQLAALLGDRKTTINTTTWKTDLKTMFAVVGTINARGFYTETKDTTLTIYW